MLQNTYLQKIRSHENSIIVIKDHTKTHTHSSGAPVVSAQYISTSLEEYN